MEPAGQPIRYGQQVAARPAFLERRTTRPRPTQQPSAPPLCLEPLEQQTPPLQRTKPRARCLGPVIRQTRCLRQASTLPQYLGPAHSQTLCLIPRWTLPQYLGPPTLPPRYSTPATQPTEQALKAPLAQRAPSFMRGLPGQLWTLRSDRLALTMHATGTDHNGRRHSTANHKTREHSRDNNGPLPRY
jgi:hypothetical protein